MSVIFRKCRGELVFKLANFNNKRNGHPYVEYEFEFDNDGFKTKLLLEAEPFDIKGLLDILLFNN